MTLIIRIDSSAGETIDRVCNDLQSVADKLGIVASSDFNGVKVYAVPGGNASTLRHAWSKAFTSDEDHKSAWSHHVDQNPMAQPRPDRGGRMPDVPRSDVEHAARELLMQCETVPFPTASMRLAMDNMRKVLGEVQS